MTDTPGRFLITALSVALAAAVLHAQAGRGLVREEPGFRLLDAQPGRPGPIVKGAPYSADISSETIQTLADGNKIHRTSLAKVYRDSEGRTRRETSLSGLGSPAIGGSPQLAFIDDPVAGVGYALDLTNHTGTKIPLRRPPPRNGPPSGRAVGLLRLRADNANIKTESLGREVVAGVPAEGSRVTETIPAGKIGNLLPIVIVTESWYAPDLQRIVLRKRSDPRSGETVFQMTNIVRAEPPASLFAPSAEFQIRQPDPRMRREPGGAP